MMRPLRPLVLLTVSTATVAALLAGCTSPAPTTPAGSPSAGSPSAGSPTSPLPSPSTAGSPSASASSPAAAAEVTINITIKDHQVSPSGEKINLTKGQTVVMHVTSDADDEVHAHNAGDGYELEVKAGVRATGQFVATDTGTFEVESHHLDKIIAILVVR